MAVMDIGVIRRAAMDKVTNPPCVCGHPRMRLAIVNRGYNVAGMLANHRAHKTIFLFFVCKIRRYSNSSTDGGGGLDYPRWSEQRC